MTRHDLSIHLERKKAKTTAALAGAGHNSKALAAGQWRTTRGGHVVKLTHVGPIFIDGTIWKQWGHRWVCFGQYSWRSSGRYLDTLESCHDLLDQIDQPVWAEELGAAA